MKEGKAYIGDEIVEGNRSIAKFTGDVTDDSKEWINTDKRLIGEYKYHSSWDWLIPAWNKFLSVADEVLGLEKNERYRNDTYRIFHNCIDNNNCERAAMFLVERITWYNQNKQS